MEAGGKTVYKADLCTVYKYIDYEYDYEYEY